MRKTLILCVLVLATGACNTSPSKNADKIKNIDKAQLLTSPAEALKKLPTEATLEEKKIAVKFTEQDKFLLIKGKNAPVKKVQFVLVPSEKNKYLMLSGETHNVGMAKNAAVFPEVYLYNAQKKLVPLTLSQAGYEDMCGMFTCLRKIYNISKLPAGTYTLVVASYVENPDETIHMFATQVHGAGAVGALAGTLIDQKLYADYFGELAMAFSPKLPFDKKSKSAITFEN